MFADGVRRNQPCPCGSGLRHKRCCGAPAVATPTPLRGAALQERLAQAIRDHEQGRITAAEPGYRLVLASDPQNFDAMHLLGVLHFQRRQLNEAERLIRRALDLRPAVHLAWNNLGSVLQAQQRLTDAAAAFRRATALQPDDAVAQNNLGNILSDLDQPAVAEAHYRRAIALRPDFADAWNNLGSVLKDLGQWDAAGEMFQQALTLDPRSGAAYLNLGNLRHLQGRLAEARAAQEHALRLDPNDQAARFNLALVQLTEGDFAAGWAGYECRWHTGLRAVRPQFAQPCWEGGDLDGKTILLYAEQGLGDTLQFVRYAEVLQQRYPACRVVVTCQPELGELLRTSPGVATVVTVAEELPAFDCYCPMLSLPRVLATTLASIPANIPYLRADPVRQSAWSARLAHCRGLRVGLVWAGNPRLSDAAAHRVDQRRSLRLAQLGPLREIPGITWISLQKGPPAAEAGAAGAPPLLDWTGELQTFADTAALVANLDLVVTVDTSVAHLAGGMGTPVWMLSRFDACFRWLRGRSDSPWYPGMRIFRQPRPGAWSEAIRELAQALRNRVDDPGTRTGPGSP